MTAALHIGVPSCGSCGYDTTGLLSLTCPECGADLRVAGITRGRVGGSYPGFFVSIAAFLVPWAVCGMILAPAVSLLVPRRHFLHQSTRLSGPQSAAYQAIDIVAAGTGWEGERATVKVELQLTPAAGSKPAAPMPVKHDTGTADVLAWMSSAGINPQDPKVRDEAQAVTMNALRSLRTRHRYVSISSMSRSFSGGNQGPFGSTSTTESGGADRTTIPFFVFGVLWLGVLAAGITFIWRAMGPRRDTASA